MLLLRYPRTNIQDQSLRGSLCAVDAEGLHPTHNWADEVYIENGTNVHNMEDDGDAQETHTPQTRHGAVRTVGLIRDCVMFANKQCQSYTSRLPTMRHVQHVGRTQSGDQL
jgi:hypothetical protein